MGDSPARCVTYPSARAAARLPVSVVIRPRSCIPQPPHGAVLPGPRVAGPAGRARPLGEVARSEVQGHRVGRLAPEEPADLLPEGQALPPAAEGGAQPLHG